MSETAISLASLVLALFLLAAGLYFLAFAIRAFLVSPADWKKSHEVLKLVKKANKKIAQGIKITDQEKRELRHLVDSGYVKTTLASTKGKVTFYFQAGGTEWNILQRRMWGTK